MIVEHKCLSVRRLYIKAFMEMMLDDKLHSSQHLTLTTT